MAVTITCTMRSPSFRPFARQRFDFAERCADCGGKTLKCHSIEIKKPDYVVVAALCSKCAWKRTRQAGLYRCVCYSCEPPLCTYCNAIVGGAFTVVRLSGRPEPCCQSCWEDVFTKGVPDAL